MTGFGQAAGPEARSEFGVLYRVEDAGPALQAVLVQSSEAPRWTFETRAVTRIEGPKALDGIEARVLPGALFRFRLQANPTRRVHHRATLGPDLRELDTAGNWSEAAGIPAHERTGVVRRPQAEGERWWRQREDGKRIGKRVELRGEEERIAWLARRGREQDGFELVTAKVIPGPAQGDARSYFATRADPGPKAASRQRHLSFGTALFEGQLRVSDAQVFRRAWAEGIGPGKAFGCGLLSLAPAGP